MKLSMLVNIIDISKECVGQIVKKLYEWKSFLRDGCHVLWISIKSLRLIKQNKKLCDNGWSMDKSLLKSNRQSAEWLLSGECRSKRPKTLESTGKVLDSIFLLTISNMVLQSIYNISMWYWIDWASRSKSCQRLFSPCSIFKVNQLLMSKNTTINNNFTWTNFKIDALINQFNF